MITQTQKDHVRSSLERLSCPPIELMERFYDRLFETSPETEGLFRGNMQRQYEKLLDMITLVTHSLDNLDQLVVAVEELGAAHVRFRVEEHHYDAVGAALIDALSRSVTGWDEVDQDAWATLYGYLSDLMITGGRGVEKRAG